MRRINTPNKVVDKFGAGKHGYKNGNKALGIIATELEADWFDSVQEEIANVIEGSGAALNPADNTQLLTAVQSLTNPIASQVEVDAGTVNTKSVTPLRLKNGFAISLTTNGYIKLPSWLGGLIIQWGISSVPTGNSSTSVTFPLTFPTACLQVILAGTYGTPTGGITADQGAQVASSSTTGFTYFFGWDTAGGGTTGVPYVAFGN